MNVEAMRSAYAENFSMRGEIGASVSVWVEGKEIVGMGSGFKDKEGTMPWDVSTPVLVWSATKGMSAACLLHAFEGARLPLATRVSYLWPEFGAAGKRDVTLETLLQHQAGLCALNASPPVEDCAAVFEALAAQEPAWVPGTAHGYHPRTFGFLLDAVLRKITGGESLGAYWRRVFAEPLELQFWIGAPPEIHSRIAPVFAPKGVLPKDDPFFTAFMTPGSLTSRSFASPKGLHSAGAMNTPEARQGEYAGFGGIGTASAIAKFYAMLACEGTWSGRSYFKPETLLPLQRSRVQGADRVLQMDTAFSWGFMRDPEDALGRKRRKTFGPESKAFGHPGAGGSVGFADPTRGLGFAYVMNQMEPGVLPNMRALSLIEACYKGEASGETA
jgi:CubicO group peptidase (beta-lactamase class C family)